MELPASAWALKQVTTLWTAVTFISLEMPLNATYVKTYARLYLWYDAEAWCSGVMCVGVRFFRERLPRMLRAKLHKSPCLTPQTSPPL